MRILIVNPNTTASMTQKIKQAALDVADTGTKITAVNPLTGPAAIQGREDGEAALPGLFEIFQSEIIENCQHDMVIVACFDDTGLLELKKRSPVPVLGIGEAAFYSAMMVSSTFSVVTTLSVSIPVIEENIQNYGFATRCAKVRASEIPVLELENNQPDTVKILEEAIQAAITEDQCGAIVLGCAGMVDLAESLSKKFKMPVIDGVVSAVTFCEALYKAQNPKPN